MHPNELSVYCMGNNKVAVCVCVWFFTLLSDVFLADTTNNMEPQTLVELLICIISFDMQ